MKTKLPALFVVAAFLTIPFLPACHRGASKPGSGDTTALKAAADSSARVDSMIDKAVDTLKAH